MAAIRLSVRGAGRALSVCLALVVFAVVLPLAACMAKPAIARSEPGAKALVLPVKTIQGGWLAARIDANGVPFPDSLKGFKPLVFPSALAVRGNDLYIADAGANRIYRYESDLQALIEVPKTTATTATRLQVAADLSLYILDPARSVIVRLARGGQILQTLNPTLATARFTEFVVDDSMGRIYASDQLNQQLFMLHPMGNAGLPLTWPDSGEVRILGALAATQQTLYAIDTGTASIVALTREGRLLGRIGQGDLVQPRALVVDRYGRIYVSDGFDRTLKVFYEGMLIARFEPGKLGINEITAIALDRDLLYIADGPGAKVMVLRLEPAKAGRGQ